MTWFKIDDKLFSHPKWTRCTADAKAVWVSAGAWSASYKTDGIVHHHDLAMIAPMVGLSPARVRTAAANLVANEMWRTLDNDIGWMFHNWTDFNPSRQQQETDAAMERERKAIHRDETLKAAVRLRDSDRCRYCDVEVNFAARRGHLAGRYDHVIPIVKGGRTTIENVVVCCNYHNGMKWGKTLDDAGLTLLTPHATRPDAPSRLNPDLIPIKAVQARVPGRDGSGRIESGRNGTGTGTGHSDTGQDTANSQTGDQR